MDGSADGTDRVLELIVDKYYVLDALTTAESRSLSELAAATEHAKSTVNRTVRQFEAAGLVDCEVGTSQHRYSLTRLGVEMLAWYEEGLGRLGARSLYASLPAEASLPWWIIETGSVDLADEQVASHGVFDQILAFFDRIDRFRVAAPNLTRDATWTGLADRIAEDGLDMEMILTESYLELLTERFADTLPTLIAEHDLDAMTVPDADFPYGFGIGYHDDGAEVAIICYDENYYSAIGTIVNDSPAAVTWAEHHYECHRKRADRRNADVLAAAE